MVPIGITVEPDNAPTVLITDAVAAPSRKTVIKMLLFFAACPRSSIAVALLQEGDDAGAVAIPDVDLETLLQQSRCDRLSEEACAQNGH